MESKMGPSEFYRHTAMPTAAAMGKGDAVDLSAESLHGIEGTFMNQADMRGGPTESAGLESETEATDVLPLELDEGANEDSSYKSNAKEDYLNQVDAVLAEDEELPRSDTVHYYVPTVAREGAE
jgi:hypothetical protein